MKTAPQFHRLRRRSIVLDAAWRLDRGLDCPMIALQAQSDTDKQLGIIRPSVNVPLPQQQKLSSGLIEQTRSVACEKLRGLHPPRTPSVDQPRAPRARSLPGMLLPIEQHRSSPRRNGGLQR
jgi:hypothetical protein